MKLKGSSATGIQSTSDLVEDLFNTVLYDNDSWNLISGKRKDESLCHQE
jgi:hypothetical protein